MTMYRATVSTAKRFNFVDLHIGRLNIECLPSDDPASARF